MAVTNVDLEERTESAVEDREVEQECRRQMQGSRYCLTLVFAHSVLSNQVAEIWK